MCLSPVVLFLIQGREKSLGFRRILACEVPKRAANQFIEPSFITKFVEQVKSADEDRLLPQNSQFEYRAMDIGYAFYSAKADLVLKIEKIPQEWETFGTRNLCWDGHGCWCLASILCGFEDSFAGTR